MFSKSFVLFSALFAFFSSAQANTEATSTSISTTASPTPTSSPVSKICGSASLGDGKCGWVSGSSTRSTYSILWSCFAVILLCTYKVIHLSICSEAEYTATWKQWPFYSKKLKKVKWMLVAVLAPEVVASCSCDEWLAAKSIRLEMKSKGYPCSMVLAFYIYMGGLAIRTSSGTILIRHKAYKALMDIDERDDIVAQLPYDQDILDRSKTDSLTVVLACMQSIWLVVQCIGRTVEGTAISELELSTCGFVLCSLTAYALWWNKPYDVEHRTIIELPKATESISRIAEILKENNTDEKTDYGFDRVYLTQIPDHDGIDSLYVVVPLGILLSAVHLAAWNWAFPSQVELWLWRVSSLSLLSTCFVFFLFRVSNLDDTVEKFAAYTSVVIYCIARVIILVQIFLCFRAMPESVYREVAWAQFIPHLS
ncbi:uncharacterized protein PAC_05426 [Phialocephala subalpina]|uniref:Uncharacterized protein n=1 Tax=Phialocephala subalpina TaxID=576137 RepID=A0A1L7WRY8_9HELO|nr:uncharacterized protein PAC_05426 [Phialocephala subalpina]